MEWTIDQFESFKNRYPKINLQIDSISWTFLYTKESQSDKTILFIHGTTGSSEIFWLQLEALKKYFRVISIDIPVITDIFKISESLNTLLFKLEINSVILLGTSFGGYLAQAFAKMYPNMVSAVVLSNTFFSTEVYYQKYKFLLKYERLIPTFVLKLIMRRSLKLIGHEASRNYLLDQLHTSLNKMILITRLRSFINEITLEKAPIDSVYIIETENDPLVPISLQENLCQIYSSAKVYTFDESANHFPYLTKSVEYNQILLTFLGI